MLIGHVGASFLFCAVYQYKDGVLQAVPESCQALASRCSQEALNASGRKEQGRVLPSLMRSASWHFYLLHQKQWQCKLGSRFPACFQKQDAFGKCT
eukprot:1159015-Pelagomonas_calceolata.AAC.11